MKLAIAVAVFVALLGAGALALNLRLEAAAPVPTPPVPVAVAPVLGPSPLPTTAERLYARIAALRAQLAGLRLEVGDRVRRAVALDERRRWEAAYDTIAASTLREWTVELDLAPEQQARLRALLEAAKNETGAGRALIPLDRIRAALEPDLTEAQRARDWK